MVALLQFRFNDLTYSGSGAVNTQANSLLNADALRQLTGHRGEGIKIGVISNGVDDLAEKQKTHEVPENMVVNQALASKGYEGTAMIQLVHDMAPDAKIFFTSDGNKPGAPASLVDRAIAAFQWLVDQKVDIIVTDVSYNFEPVFFDGRFLAQYRHAAPRSAGR